MTVGNMTIHHENTSRDFTISFYTYILYIYISLQSLNISSFIRPLLVILQINELLYGKYWIYMSCVSM